MSGQVTKYGPISFSIVEVKNGGKYADITGLTSVAQSLSEEIKAMHSEFTSQKDLGGINWKAEAKATLEEGFTKIDEVFAELESKASTLVTIASHIEKYKEAEQRANSALATVQSLNGTTYTDKASFESAYSRGQEAENTLAQAQSTMNQEISAIEALIN